MEVTPKLGKEAQDTWRPPWPYGSRLDKNRRSAMTEQEARLGANQDGGGCIWTSV